MQKLILKALGLTLLSMTLSTCDGYDDHTDKPNANTSVSGPSTFMAPTNAAADQPIAPPVVATTQVEPPSAPSALPDPLATSDCADASLDDTAIVGAALKGAPTMPDQLPSLVPAPAFGTVPANTSPVTLSAATIIQTQGSDDRLASVSDYLQAQLKASTGFALPVNPTAVAALSCIKLQIRDLEDGNASVDSEGYSLVAGKNAVVIRSPSAAGLFHGVQTLLQLLPAKVYSQTTQAASWTVPAVGLVDWPRFAYRGGMLDVARTFFSVDEVKRYIDELALLKINVLHLHLADDQGWRIQIDELPALTDIGGISQIYSTSDPSHHWFYTRDQYKDIVAYAGSRFITVVPEIEGPGHATAARASIPDLNCSASAAPKAPTVNDDVGTPIICLDDAHLATTQAYLKTVIASLAAITPGPYVHIGSDETSATAAQMTAYTAAATAAAQAAGKTLMGWNELATGDVPAGTVLQYWGSRQTGIAEVALAGGSKFVMSPYQTAYIDQGYPDGTPTGNHGPSNWAGTKNAQTAYEWEPTETLKNDGGPLLADKDVLGVEGTYWSEYTTADHTGYLDYMAFPRMGSLAELGWSPKATHGWTSFKDRLGDQGARWEAFGVGYHRSPEVTWKSPSTIFVLNR